MLCLFSAKKHPPCTAPTLPTPTCLESGNNHTGGDCLESGIGFGNKCFYFLDEEVDWEESQHSCLSRRAQLATIDTEEELVRETPEEMVWNSPWGADLEIAGNCLKKVAWRYL